MSTMDFLARIVRRATRDNTAREHECPGRYYSYDDMAQCLPCEGGKYTGTSSSNFENFEHTVGWYSALTLFLTRTHAQGTERHVW